MLEPVQNCFSFYHTAGVCSPHEYQSENQEDLNRLNQQSNFVGQILLDLDNKKDYQPKEKT